MKSKFSNKLKSAIQENQSFVLYRKPNETSVWLNVQDNSGENKILFRSFDSKTEKIISDENPIQISQDEFQFESMLNFDKLSLTSILFEDLDSISKENYEKLIQKTIDKIQNSNIRKIVISRIKIIENQDYNLFKTFQNLVQNHPSALVYLWHHPNEETWMGATPELLLSQTGNQIQTVSLAGTKLPEMDWTQKEIDEQQFVTDYIAEELADLENLKISEPETVQAGKFQHLKSYISAEIPNGFDVKNLIQNLHPTPAVCGLPKNEAFDFIIENEGYGREFYSGFIGIEKENMKDYFVNLRCAQIFQNQIKIYVGGGITAESNPEKEWEETELKSGTVGNALKYEPNEN
jgi:isochorismate synthase